MLMKCKAFYLGVLEARLTCTTHFEDYDLLRTYERGRNLGRLAIYGRRD